MSRKEWLLQLLPRHEKASPLLIYRVENARDADLEVLATAEARRAYNMAREVAGENHRLVGYMRFQIYKDRVLWAEAKPRHRIEDMTMYWLGRRYPSFGIALSTPRGVYAVHPGGSPLENPPGTLDVVLEEVAASMPCGTVWWDDVGDGLWETYYDSQYISSRKNLPLFHKAIPKKCMDTIPGLAKEKRGVGTRTLDSYVEEG